MSARNRFRFTSDPMHIVDALVKLTGGEREVIAAAIMRTYVIGHESGRSVGVFPIGEWRDAMVGAGFDAEYDDARRHAAEDAFEVVAAVRELVGAEGRG